MVQRENAAQTKSFGCRHQRSVPEVHRRILVLLHQEPHALPFVTLCHMKHDQTVGEVAPKLILRRETPRTAQQKHNLHGTKPCRQKRAWGSTWSVATQRAWCASSWSISATRGPVSQRVTNAPPRTSLPGNP